MFARLGNEMFTFLGLNALSKGLPKETTACWKNIERDKSFHYNESSLTEASPDQKWV